jgi:hypothetical protein
MRKYCLVFFAFALVLFLLLSSYGAAAVPETATPAFKPAAGTYPSAQNVTITDGTAKAIIYYTTNGNTPTTSSTKYTGTAIKVSTTETIKAIAVATGYSQSALQTATYTIKPLTISTGDLQIPQGMATMPYGMNVTWNDAVSGGTTPYSFSYTGLPSWASHDQKGNITGTPTAEASSKVTLTVKDSSNPQQKVTAVFTLPVVALTSGVNDGLLKGQYTCYVHQIDDSSVTVDGYNLYLGASVFAFTSNGEGKITGGELDSNSPKNGYESNTANGNVTGTYAVGLDDRGYFELGSSSNSLGVSALAAGVRDSSGYYSEFRFVSMHDVGTSASGKHGGGLCFKQYYEIGTTTLSGQKLSGGYVFGLNGESKKGQWGTNVGSLHATSGSVTGVMDNAIGTTPTLDIAFTGSVSAADSYGRVTFTCGSASYCTNMVLYITNQPWGLGVIMSTAPHNNGNDFWVGQIRTQNAAHIATAHPLVGPFVIYATGLGTGGSQDYKAMVGHGSGSSSAKTLTIDANVANDAGTVKLNHNLLSDAPYTVNTTTGRTTMVGKSSADVFYLYGTSEAVFMFADTGNSGGSTPQNMLGWLEAQVVPTANSGKWVYSDLATNYFMGNTYTPNFDNHSSTGVLTLDSSGNLHDFAQDTESTDWADWDEGLAGHAGKSATGVLVPNSTLDPSGKLGIFDVNVTQEGTTTTQVYCFATSVDHATEILTKGSLVCIDANDKSPKISIVRE